MPWDLLDARRIALRIGALTHALEHLPDQARRFARWQARIAAANAAPARSPRRVWPLRMGRLPVRRGHEVHEVLLDLHQLALWSLEKRDTS